MEETNRVAIFIDGSNLYHSLEENCGRADLDFELFTYKLAAGRSIYRTYYYNIQQDAERNKQAYLDQQKFFASLYAVPRLEIRLGTQKMRGDTLVEKGVDIMLATDLLQYAWGNLYDIAILVSGDADFTYAVQTVKNFGKYVDVAAFPANLSLELTNVADDRVFFDQEYFQDLWVSGRKGQPARRRRRRQPRPNGEGGSQAA